MTHTPLPPFAATGGPRDAPIVVVGEAWGQNEEALRRPLVGYSGVELAKMLHSAGLAPPLPTRYVDREAMRQWWTSGPILATNVLALRPPDNNLEALCAKRAEVGATYSHQPLSQGKYLRPEYLPELARLQEELHSHPRHLVLALGATACWALLGSSRISALRGVVAQSAFAGTKVLPTYHPAAVLRNWSLRPVVMADLLKARRESEFPEIRRPQRTILINPSLKDIERWVSCYGESPWLAVDIETLNGQITCIGFAPSASRALVIPFVNLEKPDNSYWSSAEEEAAAWQFVRKLLEGPAKKIFQNGLYDLSYILRLGLAPNNCTADTMLLSHTLWPELQKGLGFLGSIFSNESQWKLMRTREENKRDA